MASMFYEPAVEILKNAKGKRLGAAEVRRQIIEKYPNLNWSGTQGPVRAMLLSAAEKDTPIKYVAGSKPPLFYYDDTKCDKIAAQEVPEASIEEIIEEAYAKADAALKRELLEKIRKMDATAFEYLVNQLVGKLGFGTPKTTQRSHDGGIDGYIYADCLGLNVIGVQAKRYDGHNVQRPEIDKFIGALEGRDGVFVTSSSFSEDAKKKAANTHSNSKIALIDGDRMVDFMIKYNLGVQETDKKYVLKRIDHDFFEELEG